MNQQVTFTSMESTAFRIRLEDHLEIAFSNQTISRYQETGLPTAAQQLLPQIKLAYAIWLGMRPADRHAVLGKFCSLYNLYATGAGASKTLVFCAVFVNEFADILAGASHWPH